MSCISIPLGSNSVFRLRGARNPVTGEYLDSSSTVEITLKDALDVDIPGMTWPAALSYVVGSSGDFQLQLDSDLDAEAGDTGKVIIQITGPAAVFERTIERDVEFVEDDEAIDLWSSRTELNLMFGSSQVDIWADVNSDNDADQITAKIDWAVETATDDARTRLRGSAAAGVTCADKTLRAMTTRLAGVLLYEARGIVDTSQEDGAHRLTRHQKIADDWFMRVRAGQIRLEQSAVNIPNFVAYTDDDEDVYDPTTDPWV